MAGHMADGINLYYLMACLGTPCAHLVRTLCTPCAQILVRLVRADLVRLVRQPYLKTDYFD